MTIEDVRTNYYIQYADIKKLDKPNDIIRNRVIEAIINEYNLDINKATLIEEYIYTENLNIEDYFYSFDKLAKLIIKIIN